MRRGLYLFAVVAAVIAVGGTVAAASGTVTRIPVSEKEWGVTPRPASARAGLVTFIVKNVGRLKHELVIAKTRTPAAKLRTSGALAVVTGRVGRIGPFAAGQTRRLTLRLTPGHYVLLCNLPAHYKAGQRADFTVRA